MQDFFDNTIIVHASQGAVTRILENPLHLTDWDSEIRLVQPNNTGGDYTILRTGDAVNTSERLVIRHPNPDIITYDVRGDKLSYRVEFSLNATEAATVITEHVDVAAGSLPLTLFRPIAKHAFQKNLQALAQFAERWSTDIAQRL